jgi:hypothetical protein
MEFNEFTRILEKNDNKRRINSILCDKNANIYVARYISDIIHDIQTTRYIDNLVKIASSVIGSMMIDDYLNNVSQKTNDNIKCRDINQIIKKFKNFDKDKFTKFYNITYDFNNTDKCLNKTYCYSKIERMINLGIISLNDCICINNKKISIFEHLINIRCVNDDLTKLIIKYNKTNIDGIYYLDDKYYQLSTNMALEQKYNNIKK